jgi:hypothetical protein
LLRVVADDISFRPFGARWRARCAQ